MMKNFYSRFLVLALVFFSCDDDNNKEKPKENFLKLTKVESHLVSATDNQHSTSYIEVKYGNNGYASSIVNSYETFNGDKQSYYSKYETVYTYDSNKQLIKMEDYDYKNGVKQSSSGETRVYDYNDNGLIISQIETIFNEDGSKQITKSTYNYNQDNLMIEESIITSDDETIYMYEYDSDGKLSKKHKKSSKHIYQTYSFDNKKNPILTVLPKKWLLINSTNTFLNNILETEEENPAYDNYKSLYEYTYNKEDYPIKMTEKRYLGSTLDYTETTEFTYE